MLYNRSQHFQSATHKSSRILPSYSFRFFRKNEDFNVIGLCGSALFCIGIESTSSALEIEEFLETPRAFPAELKVLPSTLFCCLKLLFLLFLVDLTEESLLVRKEAVEDVVEVLVNEGEWGGAGSPPGSSIVLIIIFFMSMTENFQLACAQ